PGWLFQIELLVKSKPLPATTVAVPKLSTARVSSIEKKPPLRVAVPLRTVWPVPDMFPLDQVHVPSIVSVPEPVTVPLVCVRFCTSDAPLNVRVASETVRLTVLVTFAVPVTARLPNVKFSALLLCRL